MIRYTTPTKTIRVKGLDITGYDVVVSFRQAIGMSENAHRVDVIGPETSFDGTDTLVTVTLTQAQTGGFASGAVSYQVNYGLGTSRNATTVGQFHMARNLYSGEIEFAEGSAEFDEDDASVTIDSSVPAGSIGTSELADGAVTTAKVANGAVTPDKLSTSYVPTSSVAVIGTSAIAAMFGGAS